MGLYDREYARGDEPLLGGPTSPHSITLILIGINVAAFLVDVVFRGLFDLMAVYPGTLPRPWMWWQFLSYGFAHSRDIIQHILFNMIGLFFFGTAVERRIGRYEFLRFYLVAIVLGGAVWSLRAWITGMPPQSSVVGASGGVQAATILFALYYPHATILLFFVVPVKAWIAAVGFAALNVLGALGAGATGTAYDVHLVGIAFAVIYHQGHLNLGNWTPAWFSGGGPRMPRRRPSLRLHDPDKKLAKEEMEADRILEKIHQHGESSLTAAERRFMQRYSRRKRSERED